MASMNTRLNIEKLDGNIVQKHGGSKQVGFKQLGPGVETGVHGVHDEKRVWFEVELQGAQGDREAEVFQVNNVKLANYTGLKSTVTLDDTLKKVVPGLFLSPSEVYWHDSTGLMKQTKSTVAHSPFSKMLCNIYPGLHDFFVDEFGVDDNPPLSCYLEFLRQLSTRSSPSPEAKTVFQVFQKWSDGLDSGVFQVFQKHGGKGNDDPSNCARQVGFFTSILWSRWELAHFLRNLLDDSLIVMRKEAVGNGIVNVYTKKVPNLFVSAEQSFFSLPCFKENPAKGVSVFMSFVPLGGEVLRNSKCLLLCCLKAEVVSSLYKLRFIPLVDGTYASIQDDSIWLHTDPDPIIALKLLENLYKFLPAATSKLKKFLLELGVTGFCGNNEGGNVEMCVEDMSHTILRNMMLDDCVSPGSTVTGYDSQELWHLLSHVSSKREREKCESLKASSMDDQLHFPYELFHNCEAVHAVLGDNAPYCIPKEQDGIFCLGYKVRDNKFLGVHVFDVKERQSIDSKGFLKFFDYPGSRQGVEDLREHGGLKLGFKQLGPGVETGIHEVHDEKRVSFEVELQGAHGDRESEVFQV
ncbi:hypothetical protein Tco_0804638 [Tanacetum coccineum]|uniref:Uncharacterized protein n=1 Tax=Tanacetum coccineum TaxID=301880 RepID=A0ABQ5A5S0_9ASTR